MEDINNNLIDFKNNDEKENNEQLQKRLSHLEEEIKEKDNLILNLKSKIKEFSLNIEKLRVENEKLKYKLTLIEEEISINQNLYKNNSLLIQQTQRFLVHADIEKNYPPTLTENKNIFQKLKSQIIPFQLKPFYTFDHQKLTNNNAKNDFNEDKNFYNQINNEILDNIYKLKNEFDDLEDIKINENLMEENEKNKKIKDKKKVEGIKLHSIMFFKNCKKTIGEKEYKKLIEIVKLFNLKKINKEETFNQINNLLTKYPKLANEFKVLFV